MPIGALKKHKRRNDWPRGGSACVVATASVLAVTANINSLPSQNHMLGHRTGAKEYLIG